MFWKIFWDYYFGGKHRYFQPKYPLVFWHHRLIQYGISCVLTVLGLSETNSFSWLGYHPERLLQTHNEFRTPFLNLQNPKFPKFIHFKMHILKNFPLWSIKIPQNTMTRKGSMKIFFFLSWILPFLKFFSPLCQKG